MTHIIDNNININVAQNVAKYEHTHTEFVECVC